MKKTVIANLEHFWRLINTTTCGSAHVEVNNYLHVVRLVEALGAVLRCVALECIEHCAQ